MNVNFYVQPAEVWQFFEGNKSRLEKELVLIAESDENGHIYLTEQCGYPLLSVYSEDALLHEEAARSAREAGHLAEMLYRRYLFPTSDTASGDSPLVSTPPGSSIEELDEVIYEREDELRLATADYLMAVLGLDDQEQLDNYHANLEDRVLDDFCRYLAEKLHISVYRPTWVADNKTGRETYTEYPYLDVNDA